MAQAGWGAGTASFPAEYRLGQRILLPPPAADADLDGLVDAAESELAEAFKPFLIFDSHEKSRRPDEPSTLFQVRPLGCAGPRSRCGGAPLTLAVVYLNLWQWDGGYGPSSDCRDKHKGDNQEVRLTLVSRDDGLHFRVTEAAIGVFVWPTKSGAVEFRDGRRPAVYFSAGKHHQFFDTLLDGKDSPHSDWGCNDNVDGKGAAFFAELNFRGLPSNVGEPEYPLLSALDDRGFPGEDAWGRRDFCGGLGACPSDNATRPNAEVWDRRPFFRPPLHPR